MAAAADTQPKQQSVKERITNAGEKKTEGNEFFKTGNLQKAIKCYHIALLYVKDIEKPSPLDKFAINNKAHTSEDQLADIKKIRSTCYNNLSACFLKKQIYEKVVDYASKVLDNEPTNTKALFRRGQAYIHLKDVEKAEHDFSTIKTIDPKESTKKQQLSQEKEMFRKMMEGV